MGNALVPDNEEQRSRLQTNLYHAGLYGRQTMKVFLGVKMIMMVAPAIIGTLLGAAGLGGVFGIPV